jgi:hypothetical protein
VSQADRANKVVRRWERVQARAAFLLPIIRALELGLLALVIAVALFYANAEGGFLLRAARFVWGPQQRPGALFAPAFGALALMIGFASGPYVDAARSIRRDSNDFASVARLGVTYLLADDNGFRSRTPLTVKDSLRDVVAKSHDYVEVNKFDPLDDRALAQHTRRLAHYWDKRCGSAIITVDNVPDTYRYPKVKLAAGKLAILLGVVAATLTALVWETAHQGVTASHVLLAGTIVLICEGRAKRIFMPFRVL